MDWQELLMSEAISNYIVFVGGVLVGIVGLFITQRLRRRKPSIIQVQKEFESELIKIDSEIRDKLKIFYEKHPINEFHQAIFSIYNTGEKPIEDIVITFYLEGFEEEDFIESVLTSPEQIEEFESTPLGPDPNSITLIIPLLNPRKVYKDYLGVTLYASKPLVIKAITGKGYGWATKYVDKNEYITRFQKIVIEGATPLGWVITKTVDVFFRIS